MANPPAHRDASDRLLYGMTADELLNACGPAWSAMTAEQRDRYGPPLEPRDPATSLDAIDDLLTIVQRFPEAVASEGLAVVAQRWTDSLAVAALASALDGSLPTDATPPPPRTAAPAVDTLGARLARDTTPRPRRDAFSQVRPRQGSTSL